MALCLLGHKVNYFILDNQYFHSSLRWKTVCPLGIILHKNAESKLKNRILQGKGKKRLQRVRSLFSVYSAKGAIIRYHLPYHSKA